MPKRPSSSAKRSIRLARPEPTRWSVAWVLIRAIAAYRLLLAPVLPASCRFAPTCSAYAAQAIATHGSARGLVLAVSRMLRCHPWHAGGYDPVPAREV